MQYLLEVWVCLPRDPFHPIVPSFKMVVCFGTTVGIVVPHAWFKPPIHLCLLFIYLVQP